jgi:hypothetical protein
MIIAITLSLLVSSTHGFNFEEKRSDIQLIAVLTPMLLTLKPMLLTIFRRSSFPVKLFHHEDDEKAAYPWSGW